MRLLEGEKEVINQQAEEILKKYENTRENLIPILQELQTRLGYLPGPAMETIAKAINVPAVNVYGLATFYNQFRLNPPGKHQIKVCMGTACYMAGGQIALDSFERRLNIKEGETTEDRNFSLERVACVGCCSLAPVVIVDDVIEGKVTATRVDGLMLSFEMNEKTKEQKEQQQEKEAIAAAAKKEAEKTEENAEAEKEKEKEEVEEKGKEEGV